MDRSGDIIYKRKKNLLTKLNLEANEFTDIGD